MTKAATTIAEIRWPSRCACCAGVLRLIDVEETTDGPVDGVSPPGAAGLQCFCRDCARDVRVQAAASRDELSRVSRGISVCPDWSLHERIQLTAEGNPDWDLTQILDATITPEVTAAAVEEAARLLAGTAFAAAIGDGSRGVGHRLWARLNLDGHRYRCGLAASVLARIFVEGGEEGARDAVLAARMEEAYAVERPERYFVYSFPKRTNSAAAAEPQLVRRPRNSRPRNDPNIFPRA